MEEKVKAFIKHILQECEKEGFTITEVNRIPQALKFAIDDSVIEQMKSIEFTYRSPAMKEFCDNDSDSH